MFRYVGLNLSFGSDVMTEYLCGTLDDGPLGSERILDVRVTTLISDL